MACAPRAFHKDRKDIINAEVGAERMESSG